MVFEATSEALARKTMDAMSLYVIVHTIRSNNKSLTKLVKVNQVSRLFANPLWPLEFSLRDPNIQKLIHL